MSKPFHFLGIPGRVFLKFDMLWGKSEKIVIVDVRIEPTTQKPMVCRRRHLLRDYWGISPFDHLQKVNQ